ncbi:MAG: septum formation initiator family protein [Candidatus Doudnabacteria bacterium]|nr:septum formation initiator family protein [Candidatus Doudnabacteria bacterium]
MWQEFLKSKLATVLLSVVLIFVMVITAKILVHKRIIDREISKLENQMQKINKDNEQLSSLIQYLNTPEYQEKEARDKLNLIKDGEHVVVLPQNVSGSNVTEIANSKVSNYKLWFNYFFNHAN